MQEKKNVQKRIALINDLSGFGRCSLAVELPVISAMGIQCCPLPTAILSNHTGYPVSFLDDYTERMTPYMEAWEQLGLRFSAVSTGFLGSEKQIELVLHFFDRFAEADTVLIVDPVMGDHGKAYSSYTEAMCQAMKKLAARADILTPNLTEACILTDTAYHEGRWSRKQIIGLGQRLLETGPQKIVITGIESGLYLTNYCVEKGKEGCFIRTKKAGTACFGTGDMFAAIISADAVKGTELTESVKKASRFIQRGILKTMELGLPLKDGVCFEAILYTLK